MLLDEQDKYIPTCDESLKPKEGRMFRTLEEGIEFYKQYARVAGFDTRLSCSKKSGDLVTWRYVVCSREGLKNVADDVVDGIAINRRRRVSMRCDCKARVKFKLVPMVGYTVNVFDEEHNHSFVEEQYKCFMKLNRNMDFMQQKFIMDCARANIGPTQSYKLLAELLGGHDGVGCTVVDVRNFARDMKAFVEGADAQMLLNEMKRKQEICQAFSFDYEVDKEDKLNRLFWCDPVSRRNFHMFGDVVAFDTTYSTNKYCMIFAPFTGKDNHGKPVTFAAGLLSNEDAESFSWLFEKFIACMGAAPRLIITDQDLGMKVAVERVLPETRHRWCMWHIMLKLSDKVSKELHANEEFKKELNSYVWSELIEPDVFEEGWNAIMVKYELMNEVWFKTMFAARKFWVPAFFRDFSMSGLLKTTSISESENSFFKRYTRCRSNLLEFWINFNNALDAQRHSAAHLNYIDQTVIPVLDTRMPLEKQAATVYTMRVFKDFQEEVSGCNFRCRIVDMYVTTSIQEYTVEDELDNVFKVEHDNGADTFICTCKMFVRKGILCRHILYVFKNMKMRLIPEKYISGRWLKLKAVVPVHAVVPEDGDVAVGLSENQILTNKLTSSFYGWIQRIDGKTEKLSSFLSGINDLGDAIIGEQETFSVLDKKKMYEDFYGSSVPEEIQVLPPNVVKTKGSGSRLVSRKEKEVKMKNKPLRKCAKCKEMTNHDARNCDKVGKKRKENEK